MVFNFIFLIKSIYFKIQTLKPSDFQRYKHSFDFKLKMGFPTSQPLYQNKSILYLTYIVRLN